MDGIKMMPNNNIPYDHVLNLIGRTSLFNGGCINLILILDSHPSHKIKMKPRKR